jgi:hypothetical protein
MQNPPSLPHGITQSPHSMHGTPQMAQNAALPLSLRLRLESSHLGSGSRRGLILRLLHLRIHPHHWHNLQLPPNRQRLLSQAQARQGPGGAAGVPNGIPPAGQMPMMGMNPQMQQAQNQAADLAVTASSAKGRFQISLHRWEAGFSYLVFPYHQPHWRSEGIDGLVLLVAVAFAELAVTAKSAATAQPSTGKTRTGGGSGRTKRNCSHITSRIGVQRGLTGLCCS